MYNEFIKISYEITPLTMAVLCKKNDKGATKTFVLEETRDYIVHLTPTKVIDHACKFFGSSLKGRLEGTKDISNITHKAPVAIDPSSGMYFFPTASPMNKNCSWISHSHVDFVKPIRNDKTELIFKNGARISVDVSYGSILNQVQRTAQFRYSLENRMNLIKTALLEQEMNKEYN
ncbi:competence protein ComK [Pseudogracilibacillus auburnensis]|uniref:Competence protein ComK n=1 Tax=Pseudogracilibacillus auburnensis TaxID=1494959 RepID=A0A2V3W1S5_9BACI|nr:competence protein ComK [Pseudogracilibacillus auburnensis]PXW87051.1 competence protein ComK [Pseudogracilibacillus auburnensis]